MKQYTTPTIQWIFKYINLSLVESMRVILKDEAGATVEITDPEITGNRPKASRKGRSGCSFIGSFTMERRMPAMNSWSIIKTC